MNLIRSVGAIVAGLVVLRIVVTVLEQAIVSGATGGQTLAASEYGLLMNTPGMMAARLVATAVGATLGGYISARVAGQYEVTHAGIAATVMTLVLVSGFQNPELSQGMPLWMQIAVVLVTGTAMVAGAAIRARAAGVSPAAPNGPQSS